MEMNGLKCLIYACLMVGWAGCSSEQESLPQPQSEEVVLHITRTENLMTRAGISGFEVGDSIGIYAVKRTDPAVVARPGVTGNQAHNAKWIKTEEGWKPASLADKIVFPQEGEKLDFYAYYPYDAAARNPEAIRFNVKSDQVSPEMRAASDFMVARNISGIHEGVVELTFSHALAMVEVRVMAGNAITLAAGLQVQMSEVVTDAFFHLGNGVPTPGTETGTVLLARQEAEEDLSAFTFRGLVPSQEIAPGTALFRCVLEGKVYIYRSGGVALESGNRTPFELTLKAENE